MGSHARKGHKPKSRAEKPNTRHAGDSSSTAIHESPVVAPPPAPPCVAKLSSTDWNVVEEGCADVAAFALQPLQHANLLAYAVPQRLMEILFAAATPALANQPHETNSQASLQQPHAGAFYLQTAAAEALRNLVVNSVEDVVVDALAASKLTMRGASQDGDEGCITFRDGLVALLMTTWDAVQNARRDAPLVPPVVVQDEEGCDMRDSLRHAPFVVASRALEEVLQLIAVCVEGNERVAEAFSAPSVLHTLLSLLEATTSVVWETLQHPAQLYRATVESAVVWLRQYKRREAELLAAVAVAGSEVLHVLSDENEALASLLQSSEMMASHQTFLTNSLDATTIMAWLREDESSVVLTPPFPATTAVAGGENEEEREDDTLLSTSRQNILYQLCQVSLRVQGTLMNSVPSTANAARVLPLVVAVLDAHPPHSEWRRTVPLLLQECALQEEHRAALVQRALWRLRCDQAAVNVLHAAVDAICSLNEADADDETAFQQNPHASLLYSTNAMYVVGKLMKDALRLPTNANSNNNNSNPNTNTEATHVSAFGSVNCEDDVVVERALRAAAGTSGTGGIITKLQLLVLSNEVGVWSLANTLLMMVPWSGLGAEPAHIWRAIIHAISLRSQLLAEAVAGDVNACANGVTTVLEATPAATNLLRLQLESLMQMLWTLQRKQAAHAGGPLQVTNHLAATAADVDVVTRLAWDTHATPLQKQACVGVVCATCTSFKNAEATTAAARFALGILQVDNTLQSTTEAALTPVRPPPQATKGENGETRRRWIANITATDAQWRVRCEASNHIMDLFLAGRTTMLYTSHSVSTLPLSRF
ncbi:hypothetical protein TRSC58_00610 [Trypanosoma rangeli SC58]|uniref:Uncharacterized protein n=1 Tax=Trypanosoma rangeli SC58 TaxID=429131 RepID=A0A061JBC4_TRYRA|nr:hypothetical protein TRSC58_00610 [Trypanosoma rangeli SC58]